MVTGSTSGIGEAIARRLAHDGMHVIVHSRQSRDAGERLAQELDGTYVQGDLGDADASATVIAAAVAWHGRLDVLVNNAGISWPIAHDDMHAASADVWRHILEVNLVAPWVLTTAVAPLLVAARGCVVNITSHAGVRPKGSSVPYAASKAALNHVTRLMALSLGPQIRVNAVAPGLVDTPMTASWTQAQELWQEKAPMRRSATPGDVADLVSTLVTHRYITGEVIVLDGGLNLT